MRNAIKIDHNTVVTIDNAGCIGEKEFDIVNVSNSLTAYYTARVAILEQWCAGAHPTHIFLSNFTGDAAWSDYEKGIQQVFEEIGENLPPIKGSTESNFESMQSALSIMMIGKVAFEVSTNHLYHWFVVGKPLVGQEVVEQAQHVAKLHELYKLLKLGIAKQIWPVGSKGIAAECERIFEGKHFSCKLPLEKTSGPSTSVIVAVDKEQVHLFKEIMTVHYEAIHIKL
ncbi:hypothetical protein U5N28_14350 [Lysinibacillus telephonicus]|uniref:Alpha-ribazole-5-phosphate synthase n=1 Tax=Lysinibacillus telephonicus TaxID=1714840 RepID=A0A431UI77_9BACI|nr:hypothetical protein [Lysinibacillus telephonicus]RTQ89455.1 hypothetical protein EKG35_16495 [Lysinibacillus telephonicus]